MLSLLAILPPPTSKQRRCHIVDWEAVESKLGIKLPDDYKQLIHHYGVGCIGDFLWILNPVTTNEYLNLLSFAAAKAIGMQRAVSEFQWEIPYPLFPAHNSLLPWAITDNGDTLFWQIQENRASGPIVICDIGIEGWQEFEEGTIDFLTRMLTKKIVVEVFPDDFPGEATFFKPDE